MFCQHLETMVNIVKNMPTSKIDIKELRKKLKRGDVTKIAIAVGVTRQAVWKVIDGQFHNEQVIEALVKVSNKREKEYKKRLEALDKVL